MAAVVIALCYTGSLGLLGWGVITEHQELSRTIGRLNQNVQSQVANRVANVRSWCGGINAGRNYDRAFVGQFHLRYTLANLDCPAIEAKTAASAKH